MILISLKRAFLLCCLSLIISVSLLAANPLSEYVSDEVYTEGIRKFPPGEDVFKTQVYSMEGVDKGREEAVARMNGIFAEISAVTGTGSAWVTSFYYSENGTKKRKTVMGTESMKVDNFYYSVTAFKDGIKVKDVKSGYEITVLKKERGQR